MKKAIKIMTAIMCVAVVIGVCFALVACNGGNDSSAKKINKVNAEL